MVKNNGEKFFFQRYPAAFSLMICIIVSGCAKPMAPAEQAPLVRSQTVNLLAVCQKSSYSGEVRGRYESQLAFQVSGKLVERHVDLGSIVQSGDALMEIDPQDIRQAVAIHAAQSFAAASQLKFAEKNLDRYRQLYEQQAISRLQYEQCQSAYDAAVAAVRQTTAQYNQAANQLAYSTLYAASAGTISAVHAEAGQVVSAGQPVLTLVQDGGREIEISIPENRLENLHQADQIRITFWALPDVVLDGKVREISPVADKTTRTYEARISLLYPPPAVKLGMTANVTVSNPGRQKKAYIPLSAIYQTADTPGVWVVRNCIVSLHPIKTGGFGDNKVEVLSGLQDGDVIVTAGVHKLREGQKVRVQGDSR